MRVLWLEEIDRNDLPVVGGKAANLGELIRIGLPVPEGFVVDAKSFREFIERTGLKDKIYPLLNSIDIEKTKELIAVSEKIREMIEKEEMPKEVEKEIREAYRKLGEVYVAVRSSATAEDLPEASFAGQQETYLNVFGEDEVVEKVKKCWSSLFTPRAIYYRVQHGFKHEDVSIAVIIQRMINSEKSGVMFTSHPVTGEKKCIIEAVFGLGEAIVSGAVTPDTYVYDRVRRKLEEVKIGEKKFMLIRKDGKTVKVDLSDKMNQKVLEDCEILKLVEFGELIEEHYGKPQDVEWTIENGQIYVVQTRPITTIKEEKKEKVETISVGEVILKGLGASPGVAFGKVKIVLNLNDLPKVESGDVLVTTMTTPDMVPAMKKAAAIVTDEGGTTCHAAIVSRELGIPAVVGTKEATKVLKDGVEVTVDGSRGVIYLGKVEEKRKDEEKVEVHYYPPITATEVKVNLSVPDAAERAAKEADGVGLLRIEHIILGLEKHPMKFIKDGETDKYVNTLYNEIRKVVKAFYPKPVWIRTLDAPTDEFRTMIGGEEEPIEPNPMLGYRGIRRDLVEIEHLKAQFKAIKKLVEEGFTNVGVMLPLVISPEEIKKAKKIALDVGLDLSKIKFGIMVETPAAALIIEDLIKEGIDFVSIGSNDLTQYTLAVDRNNQLIANLYDERHPAVMKLIERVIKICKEHKVETSICGQAGSYPDVVAKLVEMGIDSVSANPDAVKNIREIVAKVERKIILDKMRGYR